MGMDSPAKEAKKSKTNFPSWNTLITAKRKMNRTSHWFCFRVSTGAREMVQRIGGLGRDTVPAAFEALLGYNAHQPQPAGLMVSDDRNSIQEHLEAMPSVGFRARRPEFRSLFSYQGQSVELRGCYPFRSVQIPQIPVLICSYSTVLMLHFCVLVML